MKATVDDLTDTIYKKEEICKRIFDAPYSKVYKYHIEAFLLQLIATGIIGTYTKQIGRTNEKELVWRLPRQSVCVDATSNPKRFVTKWAYEIDDNWSGIRLVKEGTKHRYPNACISS